MGKNDEYIVGYKYYLGFHMILCHGPVTAVKEMYSGERAIWAGDVTSDETLYLYNPTLFGGDRKEGGVEGYMDVEMGLNTQAKNTYLQEQIDDDVPAFRGVVGLVAHCMYVAAGSAYIKPWWVRIKNIVQTSWYSATADINNGSANAAHIIRECLTNKDWGLGVDESQLHDASFRAFALTLYNEGFGLSLLLSNPDKADKFIQEVLRHVQGVIYEERTTGKYVLKLVRDDYVVSALPIFNESNILSVESFDKPSPGELLDEVIIKYRPRNAFKDSAISFQNLAIVESQGCVVSNTINYPGIDDHDNAARVAARELRQSSSKISKAKLKVNREAWELNPGDVFKFSWAVLGIDSIVMRITKIDFGKLNSPTITIDAIEDVFALGQASYLSPQNTVWEDPLKPPVALTYRKIEEQNWWDLVKSLDQANLNLVTATSSYIKYGGIEPSISSYGFQLWTKPSGGEWAFQKTAKYVPDAFLVNDITPAESVDIAFSDLNIIEAESILMNGYAIIGNEYVKVTAINLTTGLITLGRGCLDTVPVAHLADDRIWFSENNQAKDNTEYSDGETIYGEARTETGLGILSSALAPDDSIVVDRRQHKPYPPGQFKFNSVYYPIVFIGDLTISWAHRDRLQQTAVIVDHDYGDIGPEASVTYTLELYNELGVLKKTYTGLTGTSQEWTTEEADSDISASPVTYSVPIDTGIAGWGNYTWRSIIPASSISMNFNGFNVKVQAISGYNISIGKMYIGHQASSGDPYDFDIDRVQVFFDGGNPNKILIGPTTAISDDISYNLDSTKNLVVAFFLNVGTNASLGTKVGNTLYYKGGGDDASTIDASGYTYAVNREDTGVVVAEILQDMGDRVNTNVRAVLKSVRSGVDSYQSHDFTADRAGYGFHYGQYYGGI